MLPIEIEHLCDYRRAKKLVGKEILAAEVEPTLIVFIFDDLTYLKLEASEGLDDEKIDLFDLYDLGLTTDAVITEYERQFDEASQVAACEANKQALAKMVADLGIENVQSMLAEYQ